MFYIETRVSNGGRTRTSGATSQRAEPLHHTHHCRAPKSPGPRRGNRTAEACTQSTRITLIARLGFSQGGGSRTRTTPSRTERATTNTSP